jgi:hypothetical protein
VILLDLNPIIIKLWKYLIAAESKEILDLPLKITDLRDMTLSNDPVKNEGAKILIGFWLAKGASAPVHKPTAWMREGKWPTAFWGESKRARIAAQVEQIKHWEAIEESYETCKNREATWFIDPPYIQTANLYRYGRTGTINYKHLAKWSKERKGQSIVCEARGAKWMKFRTHLDSHCLMSREGRQSHEMIWTRRPQDDRYELGKIKSIMP